VNPNARPKTMRNQKSIDATPGPRVQRLADTVDEFQPDCKSTQTTGWLSRW
jgi:hypothetical protein